MGQEFLIVQRTHKPNYTENFVQIEATLALWRIFKKLFLLYIIFLHERDVQGYASARCMEFLIIILKEDKSAYRSVMLGLYVLTRSFIKQ